MAWVRVDDHFDEHPKMAQVGPLGIALWVTGLAYSNRNYTDGFIPWGIAQRLLTWEFLSEAGEGGRRKHYTICVSSGMAGDDVDCAFVIDLLLKAGLWETCDGGYYIHDYPDYQPLKAEIEDMRDAKRRAGQAGGQASAQARANTGAQAKSNPVPTPVPVPTPYLDTDQETLISTTQGAASENSCRTATPATPAKKTKAKTVKPKEPPDPRVHAVLKAIEEAYGDTLPSTGMAANAKYVKDMLRIHSPDDIVKCWKFKSQQKGGCMVDLVFVAKDIKDWKAGRLNGGNRNGRSSAQPIRPENENGAGTDYLGKHANLVRSAGV